MGTLVVCEGWGVCRTGAFIKCMGAGVAWEGRGGMELLGPKIPAGGVPGDNGIFLESVGQDGELGWVGVRYDVLVFRFGLSCCCV